MALSDSIFLTQRKIFHNCCRQPRLAQVFCMDTCDSYGCSLQTAVSARKSCSQDSNQARTLWKTCA